MPDPTPARVAVVAGTRTPFVKSGTTFKHRSALDLANHAVEGLLERSGLDPAQVDEVVFGTVAADPRLPNLAREVVFATGLPPTTRAHTVANNCVTAITAIASVSDGIRAGRAEVGIAGGTESMSNPPLLFGRDAARVFLDASAARDPAEKVRAFARLRPRHFKPHAPGITEPSTGLTMGEHTELVAKAWQISRREQDEIALRSHRRAHRATVDGRLTAEIHPLDGIDHDGLVRPGTSIEKLAKLQPVFDRSAAGTITAGNASPLTDGAAAVLLMSEERARADGRAPLAFVRDLELAAIDPADGLLMAPAVAVPRLLRRNGLDLSDIDLVEMHEAFAAQVAANLRAWERGWKEPPIGVVDPERLNPLGSSLAVGHPLAATGARIVTTLANEMARRGSTYGLVSVCAAGGIAAALLLERA